jgi:hypothetical protein
MRMDSKQLEQLLEKYWNCETSLEEEKQLRDYFQGEVPEILKETADLFRYFGTQQVKSVGGADFDAAVIKKIKHQKPKGKSVTMLFNYARIAAGLIVVVTATYFVRQEVRKAYPPEIVDTYSDPKLALEETKKALMMISKGFNKAQKEAGRIKAFNEAEEKVQKQTKSEETI